jgi:membrane protein YqaA with SNARE-associated domain
MNKLFKKIHEWSLQYANAKWGPWILLVGGLVDASFLPLPVTTLFLALSLLNIKSILKNAMFLTAGIVAGATIGYLAGRFAWLDPGMEFTGFAHLMINHFPGFSIEGYDKIHMLYSKWGSWILLLASSTPLPYGLFSVSSGVFNINIIIFILATLIGHGFKYLLLAYLTKRMGPAVNRIIEFTWKPVALIPAACVVITLVVLKVI